MEQIYKITLMPKSYFKVQSNLAYRKGGTWDPGPLDGTLKWDPKVGP